MSILITGGTGYIGSHTVVEILNNTNDEVVILDNLSNSSKKVLDRIKQITNKKVKFYKGDIRDEKILNDIFKYEKISSQAHRFLPQEHFSLHAPQLSVHSHMFCIRRRGYFPLWCRKGLYFDLQAAVPLSSIL